MNFKDKCLEQEEHNPGNQDNLFNLGGLYMLDQEFAVALQYFQKILDTQYHEDSIYNSIVCCMMLGKTYSDSEINLFKQLLTRHPNDFSIHIHYHRALKNCGCIQEAKKEMEYLLKLFPTNMDVLCHMSDMLFEDNHIKEGLEFLLRAKKLHGINVKILMRMGKLHFHAGNIADSLNAFETAWELEKRNPEIWFYLFNIYKDYGIFKTTKPVCSTLEAFEQYRSLLTSGIFWW